MTENSLAIVKFLDDNGLEAAEMQALPGDASNRHYIRIRKDNQKFMLMVAPPEKEDTRPFVKVDQILRDAGLNAPEIFARDIENGLLLLEDFGDDQFSKVLREGSGDEREMYGVAVKLLDFLPEVEPTELKPYSEEKMLTESVTFVDWFATHANRDEFIAIWKKLIAKLDNSANKLTLLDYHADNLMWMPNREGIEKVGLLDFQDAVIGHPAYDLVSLLEDARRDVDKSIVADILKNKTPDFLRDYFILGAQRNCKIVGYFHRLNKRDNKPGYLKFLPRVWDHLRNDLEYPALAELKAWMQKNVGEHVPA